MRRRRRDRLSSQQVGARSSGPEEVARSAEDRHLAWVGSHRRSPRASRRLSAGGGEEGRQQGLPRTASKLAAVRRLSVGAEAVGTKVVAGAGRVRPVVRRSMWRMIEVGRRSIASVAGERIVIIISGVSEAKL